MNAVSEDEGEKEVDGGSAVGVATDATRDPLDRSMLSKERQHKNCALVSVLVACRAMSNMIQR